MVSAKGLERISLPRKMPLSVAVSVLGSTGLTGYFGLFEIGMPKPTDIVVVSSAAGATGSVVAQIAKHVIGCRTIGIAGGKEKCDYLVEELGLDGAIDYKKSPDELNRQFKEKLGKDGIDIYFDNVGGALLELALSRINHGARVVLCGAISVYNKSGSSLGPRNYMSLLVNRASMKGFIVNDYRDKFGIAKKNLTKWVLEGKIKHREHIVDGLENAPRALLTLFDGSNRGKVLVRVADAADADDINKNNPVNYTFGRSKL